jgi:carbonic anhydrase/acetyltransferase-like protein (isoleucine patch superfamily)
VETHSVLAPGSVLPPGRYVPSGQLWAGNPARYVRDLTKDEVSTYPMQDSALCSVSLPTYGVQQHLTRF